MWKMLHQHRYRATSGISAKTQISEITKCHNTQSRITELKSKIRRMPILLSRNTRGFKRFPKKVLCATTRSVFKHKTLANSLKLMLTTVDLCFVSGRLDLPVFGVLKFTRTTVVAMAQVQDTGLLCCFGIGVHVGARFGGAFLKFAFSNFAS